MLDIFLNKKIFCIKKIIFKSFIEDKVIYPINTFYLLIFTKKLLK